MIDRILLAVDDSPGGLHAARTAIAMAAADRARLRAVHVQADGHLERALSAVGAGPEVVDRRTAATRALLQHIARLGEAQGVSVDVAVRSGQVAGAILAEAQAWHPDVIVMARSARHVAGNPYVGEQTRLVLEFAEQPVLVVPHAALRRRGDAPAGRV